MTPEEKGLLLKDICARLVYNPFCKVDGLESPVKLIRIEVDSVDGILLDFDWKNEQGLPLQVYLGEVKPYLRPMSSMTEEEEREVIILWNEDFADKISIYHCYPKTTDFYNKHHLDYRGLITMDLALEAPVGMYKL